MSDGPNDPASSEHNTQIDWFGDLKDFAERETEGKAPIVVGDMAPEILFPACRQASSRNARYWRGVSAFAVGIAWSALGSDMSVGWFVVGLVLTVVTVLTIESIWFPEGT